MYLPNKGTSKYIKQVLADLKGKTDSNRVIVKDFNTLFATTDSSFNQKNQ